MVEEVGAACRASMGLAFEASLDPKYAGGDHPHPPPANDAPRLLTSTQVKISFVPPQNCVLLLTSFQAHMHSPGGTRDPVLMSRTGGGLTAESAGNKSIYCATWNAVQCFALSSVSKVC